MFSMGQMPDFVVFVDTPSIGPVNSREYNDKGYRYEYDGDVMKRFFMNDEIGRGGVEACFERGWGRVDIIRFKGR